MVSGWQGLTYPYGMSIDAMVGERLHLQMWQRQIPQTRLADRLGVTQGTLSRKLRGKSPWSLDELYEAAAALGCDVTDLLPQLDSDQQPFGYGLAA
jgi:transcriptional regulator with XRE-family HTH domain